MKTNTNQSSSIVCTELGCRVGHFSVPFVVSMMIGMVGRREIQHEYTMDGSRYILVMPIACKIGIDCTERPISCILRRTNLHDAVVRLALTLPMQITYMRGEYTHTETRRHKIMDFYQRCYLIVAVPRWKKKNPTKVNI